MLIYYCLTRHTNGIWRHERKISRWATAKTNTRHVLPTYQDKFNHNDYNHLWRHYIYYYFICVCNWFNFLKILSLPYISNTFAVNFQLHICTLNNVTSWKIMFWKWNWFNLYVYLFYILTYDFVNWLCHYITFSFFLQYFLR